MNGQKNAIAAGASFDMAAAIRANLARFYTKRAERDYPLALGGDVSAMRRMATHQLASDRCLVCPGGLESHHRLAAAWSWLKMASVSGCLESYMDLKQIETQIDNNTRRQGWDNYEQLLSKVRVKR